MRGGSHGTVRDGRRQFAEAGQRVVAGTLSTFSEDGVIATDQGGRVVRMNPAAEEMVGWSLEEARGLPLGEVFRLVDDTGDPVDDHLEEVLREGKVIGLPKHPALVARDGRACTITESMAPIHGEDGSILGAVLVFRDQATERAHGEALEESQAQTEAVIEASLDAVISMDEQGRLIAFNAAAERMFGHDRDDVIGEKFAELLPRHARGLAITARSLGARREMPLWRADGSEFPVEIVVVRIPAGGAATYTCFIRDLTAAKAAEQALKSSRQQLRALAGRVQAAREEERTRIARELHDELGQQLTALRMDLGWLERRQKNAPDEVVERLRALSGLVDQTFASVRRLGTELRPGILDDLGLAAAVEWQAGEFEARSGIVVVVEVPTDLAAIQPRCATAIFRIFQEILTNVGRHSGAKNVQARLSIVDGQLCFEVRDDGRGITPEEAANQESLGLLGMRERAALLGGTFTIGVPEGGSGTVVNVALPACVEAA